MGAGGGGGLLPHPRSEIWYHISKDEDAAEVGCRGKRPTQSRSAIARMKRVILKTYCVWQARECLHVTRIELFSLKGSRMQIYAPEPVS